MGELQLVNHLHELQELLLPIVQPTYIMKRRENRPTVYLQGAPLWTSFLDRAYEFSTPRMARDVMDRFPEELKDCEIYPVGGVELDALDKMMILFEEEMKLLSDGLSQYEYEAQHNLEVHDDGTGPLLQLLKRLRLQGFDILERT